MDELVVPKPMPTDGVLPLIFRPLPDLDRRISTTTGEEAAVGADGDGVHTLRVAGEGVEELSGLRVPHLDLPIGTTTKEKLPIGTYGDRKDL